MKRLITVILSLLVFPILTTGIYSLEKGIITGVGVRLREKPDGKIIAKLNKNTSVTIFENTKEVNKIGDFTAPWFKIKTEKNEEGWVFGQFLQFSDTSKPRVSFVVNEKIDKVEGMEVVLSIVSKLEFNGNKYYLFHGMTCGKDCDDDSRIVLLNENNLKLNKDDYGIIYPGKLFDSKGKVSLEITGYFGEIEKSVYGILINYNYRDHEDTYFIYKINKNGKIKLEDGKGNKIPDKRLNWFHIPGVDRDGSP